MSSLWLFGTKKSRQVRADKCLARQQIRRKFTAVANTQQGYLPTIRINDFRANFARIENILVNPSVTHAQIEGKLNAIEWRTKNRNDARALNFVAYYRKKLKLRKRSASYS